MSSTAFSACSTEHIKFFLAPKPAIIQTAKALPCAHLAKNTLRHPQGKGIPLLVSELKWLRVANKAIQYFSDSACGSVPHLLPLQRHTIPFVPVTGRTFGAPIQLQIMTIQIRVYLHACHKCLSLVHKHCVTPFSKSLNFSLWPSSIHTPATLRFTVTAAQRSALEA